MRATSATRLRLRAYTAHFARFDQDQGAADFSLREARAGQRPLLSESTQVLGRRPARSSSVLEDYNLLFRSQPDPGLGMPLLFVPNAGVA